MKTFREKVFTVVRKIPAGTVLTYKEVAHLAGNIQAARAVGNILATNYNPHMPCHRVIRSEGRVGGYNRGVKRKTELLMREQALINRL